MQRTHRPTSHKKDPMKQYQGAVSRAQGKHFEEYIDLSLRYYEQRGEAVVEKTPEPMRPTKDLGNGKFIAYYEKAAQPDYKGTLKGGRAVVFEAKYTHSAQMEQSRVTREQAASLRGATPYEKEAVNMGKNNWPDFDAIIQKAVNAGRAQGMSIAKDAYKATERRLYALPVLRQKVEDDKEKLEQIKTHGAPERSKSIVRFSRTGYRLTPEEMLEAIIKDLEATIAADEYEIETLEKALAHIEDIPLDEVGLALTAAFDDFFPMLEDRLIIEFL